MSNKDAQYKNQADKYMGRTEGNGGKGGRGGGKKRRESFSGSPRLFDIELLNYRWTNMGMLALSCVCSISSIDQSSGRGVLGIVPIGGVCSICKLYVPKVCIKVASILYRQFRVLMKATRSLRSCADICHRGIGYSSELPAGSTP